MIQLVFLYFGFMFTLRSLDFLHQNVIINNTTDETVLATVEVVKMRIECGIFADIRGKYKEWSEIKSDNSGGTVRSNIGPRDSIFGCLFLL
ncbi:MAG: hypothetical protein COX81_01870 [Candidatus Magasanikbacteria bacterium CG_4_10_14_0_2_um_filter_37_12]|uniref:Uncharacterized protein n=1 Tax=Candidatus Magasanikbacteria bacterium CG_4_10_14_0_2_um_filter_37_12 TaxID=1974637 RepID=A0A2M7V897_9BACT|nr:MAG: hypothetical protein COX81_01870 [Candidatus Magasanikbacteria bacterium CG_4_10_14_0_2_um_filter_37_12]